MKKIKNIKPNEFFDYTPEKCLESINTKKEFFYWNGEVIKVCFLERVEINVMFQKEVQKIFRFITNVGDFRVKNYDVGQDVFATKEGAILKLVQRYNALSATTDDESVSLKEELKIKQLKIVYDMYETVYPEFYV